MSDPAGHDSLPEPIAHAAAAWVLKCDRGLTAEEQDAFSEWLASDPRHGEQLARHRRHWDRLETLAQWRPEHSTRPNPDLLAPPRGKMVRFLPAAAVMAAAAAVGVFFISRPPMAVPVGAVAMSGVTAPAPGAASATQQVLTDGTVVELNAGAVLTAHFTDSERRVRLAKGEAHFTVMKNAARPFVVMAQGMEVLAVGTAFNVRLDAAVVEVLVTEGRVSVSEDSAPVTSAQAVEPAVARAPLVPSLEAGQRAVVSLAVRSEAPKIATLTPGEIERVLAWQHRMLEFTAAPLAEIVAEFNRRNVVQLVVVDPALAAVPISASFRSDNIEGFVRLVEMGFGARAERRGESEIRLHRAR